jgi:hypothetical protein
MERLTASARLSFQRLVSNCPVSVYIYAAAADDDEYNI